MNIIHIDAGKEWRGGQQQAFYLHETLVQKGHDSLMVSLPNAPMTERCRQAGLPQISLPIRGEFDLRSARSLAELAKNKNAQILHAHCSHSLSIAAWSKMWRRNSVVIGARRVDFHVRKPLLGAWKYNNSRVNAIICVSEKIRQVLLADGVRPDKVFTVYSGVDLQKFVSVNPAGWRTEWNIPAENIVIGTVAAFAGHKDYPNLLAAARIVLDRHRKVSFCAVGDGALLAPMQRQVEQMGIRANFIFPGYRKDVGRFLKNFDIFVLASKKEGLGTSLLDAQAVGLPVIGTQAGGIPEIIDDQKTGLLVPPQNPKKLADAIVMLIDDAVLRKKLGRTGQQAVSRFSIENTIQKTVAIYERLLTQD